jgi:putative endonuclease
MLARLKAWWGKIRGPRDARQARGVAGEKAAERFLRAKAGWKIVVRNWRSPRDRRDEIDLVCRDGEVLVFVEVKTRAAGALIGGYHAVDARKKRALRRATMAYLRALRDARPTTVRFDIVEVEWAGAAGDGGAGDGAKSQVRHFENVALWPRGLRW